MFHIGKRKQPAASVTREDGYTAYNAAIVCKFQACIERESDCDYEALRSALAWSKDQSSHPITMINLRRIYNDSVYASAQYSTPTR